MLDLKLKEKIVSLLDEIHSLIPQNLLDEVMVKRVISENIDEITARYLTVFPPCFLPVLELDGNIFGIKLEINKHWKSCPWVMLPHDSTTLRVISSSFSFLPYAFFHSQLNTGHFVDEIIVPVTQMLAYDLPVPDEEFILNNIERNKEHIYAKYEPENAAAVLSYETEELFSDDVQEVFNKIFTKFPNDIICNACAVFLLKEEGYKLNNPILPILLHDLFYGAGNVYWTNNMENGAEILEMTKEEVLKSLPSSHPLQKMRNTSYISKEAVPVLKEISRDFHKLGEEQLALNQLRNAAMIEGIYNGGITKELCLELAEQCDRVKKDSLAGDLARYAAEVINLGA